MGNLLIGGRGNDTLTGGAGNDCIFGGDGNNWLDGGGGNNAIFAGRGADTILAGSGNDLIHAGDGDNVVLAGDGHNHVLGGSGNDVIVTGSGNDLILAGDGDNLILAGDGNNVVHGGRGADTVIGGRGSDLILAGNGDNVIDAGGGGDLAISGHGRDLFIHRFGQNAGAQDLYDGGRGQDRLRLVFTQAEWQRADVQADVAAFLAHQNGFLNQLLRPFGLSTPFCFQSMGLVVLNIEDLEIEVAGVLLNPADQPVQAVADALTVSEDGPATAIDLLANDSAPDRIASVQVLAAPTIGTVTLATSLAGPMQTAVLVFTPDPALQSLRAGEERVETITYRITDADGDQSVGTVTLRVVGANDGAVISGVASGTVAEDDAATLTVSGALSVTDADAGEAAFVPVTLEGAFGTFTLLASGAWTYQADNAQEAIQSLGAGDTLTETFAATTIDGTGQSVTVTITGSDEALAIRGDVTGDVTEDAVVQMEGRDLLMTSGGLFFEGIDPDAQGPFFVAGTFAGSLGTFTIDGLGNWIYAADTAQAAIQSLGEGDSVTDSFTAVGINGQQQAVTVTINGANDTPVEGDIVSALAVAGLGPVTLSAIANTFDVDRNAVLRVVEPVDLLPEGVTFDAATQTFTLDPDNPLYAELQPGEELDVEIGFFVTDGFDEVVAGVRWTVSGAVRGHEGDDIIRWDGGDLRLVGGPGADTFVFADQAGTATVLDFDGADGDRLDLTAFGIADLDAFEALVSAHGPGGGDTRIDLDADTVVILGQVAPADLDRAWVLI